MHGIYACIFYEKFVIELPLAVQSLSSLTSSDIICSSLSAPNNGSVTFISNATSSSFSYLTNAIYSCAAGLGLTGGDPVRVCGGNVSTGWAGAAPVCEGEF